jgi:hypothetical protein
MERPLLLDFSFLKNCSKTLIYPVRIIMREKGTEFACSPPRQQAIQQADETTTVSRSRSLCAGTPIIPRRGLPPRCRRAAVTSRACAVVMLSRNDAAAPPREGRKFPCGGRVRAPPRLRAHAVRWICLSRPGPQPAYPRGRLRRPQDDTDIHITSYHSNADADASTHTLLFMCSPSTQEACM